MGLSQESYLELYLAMPPQNCKREWQKNNAQMN